MNDSLPRLPPGQHWAKEAFPVLDLGVRPEIKLDQWRLEISGLVEEPVVLNWESFVSLPRVEETSDFHCVTTWSVPDARWGGVSMGEILRRCQPSEDARFALLTGYDGYTTNVSREAMEHAGVLLADRLNGAPLPVKHGGPVRVVFPHLYGWKSAKFIISIEWLEADRPGYWERRGYTDTADPWREERFRGDPEGNGLDF